LFDKIFEIIGRDADRGNPIFDSVSIVKEQYDASKLRTQPLLEAVLVIGTLTFDKLMDATKPKPKKTAGGIATDGLTQALSSMLQACYTCMYNMYTCTSR